MWSTYQHKTYATYGSEGYDDIGMQPHPLTCCSWGCDMVVQVLVPNNYP